MNKYLLGFCNFSYLSYLNFLPLLLIRFYLAVIFWVSGTNMLLNREEIITFMGIDLGLPSSDVLFYLLAATQLIGAISLVAGFAVRWMAVPLMSIMVLSALLVHQNNGWLWIIDENAAIYSTEYVQSQVEELGQMKRILQENGIAETSIDKLTLLNEGIEKPAIYFLMLLVLFFAGAGRYFSMDYYLYRFSAHKVAEKERMKMEKEQASNNPVLLPADTTTDITDHVSTKSGISVDTDKKEAEDKLLEDKPKEAEKAVSEKKEEDKSEEVSKDSSEEAVKDVSQAQDKADKQAVQN